MFIFNLCSFSFKGHVKASTVQTLTLALCAVNLAEAAGCAIPTETMAEIYATAAVTVKMCLPGILQIISVSCSQVSA